MTRSKAMRLVGTWPVGGLAAVLVLGACSLPKEYDPVVDMTGHTKAQYDYDLDVCRENAKELDILKGVGLGALAGAAIGGAAGALASDAGTGALAGLGAGALAGGIAGSAYGQTTTAATGRDPHEAYVRDCLQQRGYTLLDQPPQQGAAPAGNTQGQP